jgi:predicted GIY-YIG superfamily endonuclease
MICKTSVGVVELDNRSWCDHLLALGVAAAMSSGDPFGYGALSPNSPKAGAYIILLADRSALYIGSTENLYQRRTAHITTLRNGTHKTNKLLERYVASNDKRFFFFTYETANKDTALALEQNLLDRFRLHPLLTNRAMDAKRSALGLKRNPASVERGRAKLIGRTFAPSTIEKLKEKRNLRGATYFKPVSVEGVVYPSVTAVAEKFDITPSAVTWRSKSPTFPHWKILDAASAVRPK